MRQLVAATLTRRATLPSRAHKRLHVQVFLRRTWDGVSRFAVVFVRL
jgi:hypothetical protein